MARKNHKPCSIEGCSDNLIARGMCTKHYYRWKRTGDPLTANRYTPGPTLASNGYLIRNLLGHPLAGRRGYVLEHRRALYDSIGPGPHRCYWCLTTIRWDAPVRAKDKLEADHLNGDRIDNRPENLVPSCPGCNTARRKANWQPGSRAVFSQVTA